MKRLMMITVAFSVLAQSVHAEPARSSSDEFYGIDKNKARTQVLLGSAEALLGSLLAYQALRSNGPKFVAPKSGSITDAIRASKENYKLLNEFKRTKGDGLIRSVKFLGASVAFIDAAGRVYEWHGTEAQPSWSPIYSYLMNEEKVKVEDMPESVHVKAENPADSMTIPAVDPNEKTLEAELTARLNSRMARINPGFRDAAQKELDVVKGRIQAQEQAIADATTKKQSAHDQFVQSEQEKQDRERFARNTGDFYKSRPTNDDQQLAQQVLFGGDLLAAQLLINSLFTKEGSQLVRSAEDTLKRVKALESVDRGDLRTNPNGGPSVLEELKKLEVEKELQLSLARKTNGVTAESIAQLESQLAYARDAQKALKTGKAISHEFKATLLKVAERNVAEARALAIRLSKGSSLFKAVKVVGTVVVVTDGIGRVYQWYNNDANPQFSPGITWALLKAEKPTEDILKGVSERVVEPTKEYFQARFAEAQRRAKERSDKGIAHEPIFPIGPKY